MKLALGLNRGLVFVASGGARDLSGFGAYQRGLEDTRLGISWRRPVTRVIALLTEADLGLPTGYRKQHMFYSAVPDTTGILPAFSLGQTFGEVHGGLHWSPALSATLSAAGGYFASSDRTQQAFRWGLFADLAPFGKRVSAEFGYAQSLTRAGNLPDTQVLTAGVPIRVARSFTLAPGIWSELGEESSIGISVSLRVETGVGGGEALRTVPVASLNPEPRRTGRVLVPPPFTDAPLADRDELWHSLQKSLTGEFIQVTPLGSLDLPGLPYSDTTDENLRNTARAVAASYGDARWLVVSHVEREAVTKEKDSRIPLVIERPLWKAECRLRVRWIDLLNMAVYPERTIEAQATYRSDPQLLMMSSSARDVLSAGESRRLTFEAYRIAGRELARDIPRGER